MDSEEHNLRQDETEFEQLLARAEEGDANAQLSLGEKYYDGQGVLKDYKEAMKWYRKAADQGDAMAQYRLGLMYGRGWGVLKDAKEAVKWWRKAADQGNALAQVYLGGMYARGDGILKDDVAAYAWFSLCIGATYGGVGKKRRDKLAEKMTPEQIAEAQELSKELLKQIEENKKKKAK